VSGIKDLPVADAFSIGPNPVKEFLQLSFSKISDEEVKYEIQNNLGQTVVSSSFKTDASGKARVNVQQLPQGIYYLGFKSGEGRISYKFVRQ
jgi:hypothetical protein